MMHGKIVLGFLAIVVVMSGMYCLSIFDPRIVPSVRNGQDTARSASSSEMENDSPCRLIVYYFHRKVRCPTCRKIEDLTNQTIQSDFSDLLKDRLIEWHVVNMEEPQNQHFIDEYQLYTPSVILVEMEKGKPIRWSNLTQVWDYVEISESFSEYIASQIANVLSRIS